MAFVCGDPRGHRVAVILEIDDTPGASFPLAVDTCEMLPLMNKMKRIADRHGNRFEDGGAKWRTVRSFDLVAGRVEGPTRRKMLSDALPGIIEQAVNSTAKQLHAACEEDAGSSTELEFSAVGVNPGGSVGEPLRASSTVADADTDGAIAEVNTPLHDSACLSEEDAAPTEFQSVVEASHEVVNIAASRASSAVVTTPSVVVIDVEVAGNEKPSGSNEDVCLRGDPSAADARAARTNEIASGEVTLGGALSKPSESTIACEKSDEFAGTCPAASPTEQELVEASDYLAKIPTRYQRAKIRHQAKKRPGQWSVSRSRKRRYQMKCSVTKSGSNIYHARSLKAQKIKKLLRSPGVLGRMRVLHKRRPVYAEPTQDDRLIMDEVQWPAGINEIDECVTNGITFPDIGDYHSCECVGDCFMDTCANINTAVYCTPDCCKLGALCSNAPPLTRDAETV